MLFRTDDARDDFALDVGRTEQRAALSDHMVDEMPFGICCPAFFVLRSAIYTHILCGKVAIIRRIKMSVVLGHPARGTGEGAGYHDGGGLLNQAH